MAKNEKPTAVYWMDNKLYLNITNRCSNSCFFCLKNFKRGVGGFNLKFAEEPSLDQIVGELEGVLFMRSWEEMVFCGFGEPTERIDVLLAVTRWIRQHHGGPLKIRLNTNGHGVLLNPGRDVAAELRTAGVDMVSVSLNAGNRETYVEICRPSFAGAYEAVRDFVGRAKSTLEVEVTVVRVPEVDVAGAQAVADGLGVKFRIRDYIQCYF